jgi:hypothetical protein
MVERINVDKIREYIKAGKYEQLLAALNYYPWTRRFTESEIKGFRSELGITEPMVSTASIITSFILDVLLPPPFRPPLALICNLMGG